MAKPEWGSKRICQSCGVKFYDLRRSPITCPSCGSLFEIDNPARGRRGKPAAAKQTETAKAKAPAREDDDLDDDDLVEIESDDDDELIEDTSDLGDDDDIAAVGTDDDEKDT